jgi:hypothetical protein
MVRRDLLGRYLERRGNCRCVLEKSYDFIDSETKESEL